jgi:large subunit ribosomal protein L9
MKVILIKDVPGLGEEGDTKEVAAGYARNYLFPRNLVVQDSVFNRNRMKEQRKRIELTKVKKREDAQKLAEGLSAVSITITAAAQESEKLFGAVHEIDIVKALSAMGYQIDKKNVILGEPIKTVGEHKVSVKIYENVKAEMKVWVVKEEKKEEKKEDRRERREDKGEARKAEVREEDKGPSPDESGGEIGADSGAEDTIAESGEAG